MKRKTYWHNILSLVEISNRWEEITGKPDSSSWLDELKKDAGKNKWTMPLLQVKNYPMEEIAKLKKDGKIGDVFMHVKDQEDLKAVAKFLARNGEKKETLSKLFAPDLLPLDLNEEPARELDLNQSPPPELDEAGDEGGE